ncbi:RNA polymerase sigma factor [Myxococcota bacterium]|nr:RNA polymerase sigma factor [Myxococcota bacterium]
MTEASNVGAAAGTVDWLGVVKRVLDGDRAAYARLVRLVTGHLTSWRAYDFRADWDDMVQEVLISTIEAYRAGRIPDSGALVAYVRQAARFKFIDRIRTLQRRGRPVELNEQVDGSSEGSALAWPPAEARPGRAQELRLSVREAMAGLDEREREAVTWVYLRGHTYEEASEATGIPLGTLKRALRTALVRLKETLGDPRPA